jgi:hypothetical protein
MKSGTSVREWRASLLLHASCVPVAVGFALLLVFVAPTPSLAPTPMGQGLVTQYTARGGETPACASIQNNSTLNQTYDGVYQALPAGNGQPNESGRASYPNETVGEQWLLNAWLGVCETSTFTSEYTDPQPRVFDTGVQLNNTSGHFEAWYVIHFEATCGNPTNYSTGACQFFSRWVVDLTNGHLLGQYTSSGTPQSPASNGTAPVGGPGSLDFPPLSGGLLSLAVLATATGGGVVCIIALYLRRRPPARSLENKQRATFDDSDPGESVDRVPSPVANPGQDDPLSDVY